MDIKEPILEALKKATGVENPNLEFTDNLDFGDFSSNIAMTMFSSTEYKENESLRGQSTKFKNPRELSEEIISKLQKDKLLSEIVKKIEIAGPGFINFWLKKDVLVDNLIQIDNEKDKYGRSETKKNKKVSVEFTDPNPFKEFHIGHLYSNTIGESLARLQEALGATVWRADYFGDAGIHVAKSIWGLRKKMQEDNLSLDQLGQKELKERINYMGQGYTIGSDVYEEDKDAKKEIERLNTV